MFAEDQKRASSLASSFLAAELPSTTTATQPAHVYLSAGDLERAFDRSEFRPDAAVVPTNTDLAIDAPSPATQQVLIARVKKQADVLRALQDQIAARRKQPSAAPKEPGVLRIGVDSFVARLSSGADAQSRTFPQSVCLVATDFAHGGALDRRGLFSQDRVREGIADCLSALDAGGAQSLVLPLMGAASSRTQTNDAMYEGQRTLKECRLINSTAGIALGIHDFAVSRHNLREIGVVQWDQEITGMFEVPAGSRAAASAQAAYQMFAEQIRQTFRKGLAGEKTVSSDVKGLCNAILTVR